jgi:23S rRNA (guanosine2251-2'-O)-methyltransferase
VAAGATEQLAVARDPHPARRVRALREDGFRAVALDPRGEKTWDRADLTGRLVLVAGGEARGPSPAVLAACDISVAIPLAPGVDSLNVGVAVGVLLFEAVRQRRRSGGAGLETPESRC